MLKKNRKFMKNCGLFLNMAKWCFLGLFLRGFNIERFVFGVSGIVSKVLKMLVVSHSLGLFWDGLLLFIWVWKVWVFLCFLCLFFFCVAFVSVLFALLLVLWLDVVVLFFFVVFFVVFFLFCFFLCFVFFEGLRVR